MRETPESLQRQLEEIEAVLTKMPWSAPEFREAAEVYRTYESEGKARVKAELNKRNLPPIEAVAKDAFTGIVRSIRLVFRKNKLRKKLKRLAH